MKNTATRSSRRAHGRYRSHDDDFGGGPEGGRPDGGRPSGGLASGRRPGGGSVGGPLMSNPWYGSRQAGRTARAPTMPVVDPWSAPPEDVRVRRVRWGIPDVVLAWVGGFVAAVVYSGIALAAEPDLLDRNVTPAWYIIGALVVQNAAIVGVLVVVADRKGRGSLTRDFGLVSPLRVLGGTRTAAWIAAGAVGSVLASVLLRPIADLAHLNDSAQEVSKSVEKASGVGLVLLFLGIVLLAPIVEELLFRGALLRGLQRRWSAPTAVFVSAAIFALVHVLGDPNSYSVVPGLLLLGLVSGYEASRTGNLARSVCLHMGFNLLSAVFLVLNR